jgi:light-regulated signal transduction histidine kinase (bacteriophytochrome)
VLESGEPVKQEIHYVGDGVDLWFQNSINKIGTDQIVIAFHDITPLKHATFQLERSVRELKITNEKLSDFTHIASHDLREPLRKISTYSNLVIEKYNGTLDKNVGEYLAKINRTAIRMQALINDLLTFSQVSNASNEFQPLSLNTILSEVQHDLETAIHERNARVVTDVLPEIRGDKMQITQVFQNLISNALKFQNNGNVPLIRIKREADIERDGGRFFCISVKDNGIGFDQSHADNIFRIFHRLHSRAEYSGSGIGLAIVQKALHNHGGSIEVTSEPGKGTCFFLFFPIPPSG